MVSNFTSGKGGYKKIGNFSHHCNKVLPLVYDDSLSYYEVLCKVVRYLNDVIDNINSIGENNSELGQVVEEHIASAVREIEYLKNKVGATVSVNRQHLSAEEQAQARANIGACAFSELADKLCRSFTLGGSVVSCETTEGFPLHVVSHLRENNSVSIPLDGEWNFDDYVFPCLYLPKLEDGEYMLHTNCDMMIPVHLESRNDSDGVSSDWGTITPIDGEGNPDFGITMDTFSFKPHPDCVYRLTYIHEDGVFTHEEILDTLDLRLERVGHTSIKLTQKNGKTECVYDVEIGDTVSGGYYDWSSGVLTDSNGNTRNFAPHEITALAGTNTIYSDSGDTDVGGWTYADSVVLYTPQKLNDEQRAQVRENIGAVGVSDVGHVIDEKALVEKFAPAFTKTAPVVTCNPFDEYPLEVITHLSGGRTDNIIEKYNTDIDNYGNPTIAIELPAGKYALWYKGQCEVYVASNYEDNIIENIDYCDDEQAEREVEFTHSGGKLLIIDPSWCAGFNENNLKLVQIIDVSTYATLRHNDKVYTTHFPVEVPNGTFNWSTGVLSVPQDNPNLIPVDLAVESNWNYEDEVGIYSYRMELPEGYYIISVDERLDLYLSYNGGELYGLNAGPATFTHNGGIISLTEWGGIYGAVTIKLVEPHVDTYKLASYEIVGLPGVNTLKSNIGNTEVSGRANITAMLIEQAERISALEAFNFD